MSQQRSNILLPPPPPPIAPPAGPVLAGCLGIDVQKQKGAEELAEEVWGGGGGGSTPQGQ